MSQLKQEYKEGKTKLSDALDLAIKVLSKTLDMTKLSADKIELAVLQRDEKTAKTTIRLAVVFLTAFFFIEIRN